VKELAVSEIHQQHLSAHNNQHGPNCGLAAVKHDGQINCLHDNHLHHPHGDLYGNANDYIKIVKPIEINRIVQTRSSPTRSLRFRSGLDEC